MGLFSRKTEPKQTEQRSYDTFCDSLSYGRYSNEGAIQSISAVYSAIELISNSLASLPIIVRKNNDIVDTHPVYLLFKNSKLTKFMLIKQLIQDAIVHGKGCAYIRRGAGGVPKEIVYCERGQVNEFYNFNAGYHYFLCPPVSKEKIDPSDMICLYKNSRNGFEGQSIIKYAKKIFDLCKYTDNAATDFFSSGCNLNGILTVNGVPDSEISKIRAEWKRLHDGGSDSSGLAILRGNMKYDTIGTNANDSQLLQSRLFNVTEVARFFNINPTLLGDLSHTSYNSLEQAQLQFVTTTLLPYIVMIEEEFSRKLLTKDEYEYTIDLDETILLRTDKNALSNYLQKLVNGGIITRNEARKMLGLGPVDGGDRLMVAFTNVNSNTIGSTDDTDVNSENDDKNA